MGGRKKGGVSGALEGCDRRLTSKEGGTQSIQGKAADPLRRRCYPRREKGAPNWRQKKEIDDPLSKKQHPQRGKESTRKG